MDATGRRPLPHERPLWLGDGQTYFVTLCAQPRGTDILLRVASQLIDSFIWRHDHARWFGLLLLVMPDHVHALLVENPERPLTKEIRDWKKMSAREHGIPWQRDFFEHRLRHSESRSEKFEYIVQNPVRAGLVARAEDWPHVWREATDGWASRPYLDRQ
jgi:putative transposase